MVHAVADALAARFAVCSVRGELSGVSRPASGHCYFSLKDADGQAALVRCAMFRRAASMLDFTPSEGERVEVRGRLVVYEPRGELQLVVESMRRDGAGSLYEQFLRLKARLEAEGLFDPSRKRALPLFARRVGIVTSLGAAALHDVLAAFARRAPHVELIVYPSLVQGREAPQALAEAIDRASARAEVDVLLVCRGGGSLEDLWAFNDERTVRAAARCSLPLVSGVGHETDVTLIDFAADVRATTPTAAAELVARPSDDWLGLLDALQGRLRTRVHRAIDTHAQRIDTLALKLARPSDVLRRQATLLVRAAHRLSAAAHRTASLRQLPLARLADRLQRAPATQLQQRRQQLDALGSRLAALDPERVLKRGYAWLEDANGTPVTSIDQLAVDQALRGVLADGAADLRVRGLTRT